MLPKIIQSPNLSRIRTSVVPWENFKKKMKKVVKL